jgi:hypothetical protein
MYRILHRKLIFAGCLRAITSPVALMPKSFKSFQFDWQSGFGGKMNNFDQDSASICMHKALQESKNLEEDVDNGEIPWALLNVACAVWGWEIPEETSHLWDNWILRWKFLGEGNVSVGVREEDCEFKLRDIMAKKKHNKKGGKWLFIFHPFSVGNKLRAFTSTLGKVWSLQFILLASESSQNLEETFDNIQLTGSEEQLLENQLKAYSRKQTSFGSFQKSSQPLPLLLFLLSISSNQEKCSTVYPE